MKMFQRSCCSGSGLCTGSSWIATCSNLCATYCHMTGHGCITSPKDWQRIRVELIKSKKRKYTRGRKSYKFANSARGKIERTPELQKSVEVHPTDEGRNGSWSLHAKLRRGGNRNVVVKKEGRKEGRGFRLIRGVPLWQTCNADATGAGESSGRMSWGGTEGCGKICIGSAVAKTPFQGSSSFTYGEAARSIGHE